MGVIAECVLNSTDVRESVRSACPEGRRQSADRSAGRRIILESFSGIKELGVVHK